MSNKKSYLIIALILASLFGVKALASLTLNATTVAGSGDVIVSSGGTTSATFSIPTGASQTSNFFNITGTLPSAPSVTTNAVNWQITSSGSGAIQQRAVNVDLLAGYTGSAINYTARFNNATAGTIASGWTTGASAAIRAVAQTSTAGHKVAGSFDASGSSVLNAGVISSAVLGTNTPALNLGAGALALNGTLNVGGFFGLMNAAPTLSSSAALIADNGATTSDIFKARDNGLEVFRITDGGHFVSIQASTPTPSSSGTGYSGGSVNAGSTDAKGTVSALVGTGSGYIRLTFQTAYDSNPTCIVTPVGSTTQVDASKTYISSGPTSFDINYVGTPTGGIESWNYICIQ